MSFRVWQRDENPRHKLVTIFDQIHDELNQARATTGRPRLPTVNDVRRERMERMLHLGIKPLATQLAELGPLSIQELGKRLTDLGHKLGPKGVDLVGNRVHVIHPHSAETKSYHLDKLLADVDKACSEGVTPHSEMENQVDTDVEIDL